MSASASKVETALIFRLSLAWVDFFLGEENVVCALRPFPNEFEPPGSAPWV